MAFLVVLILGITLSTIAAQALLPSGHVFAYYGLAVMLTALVVAFMMWVFKE
jgi:hypothetical protein